MKRFFYILVTASIVVALASNQSSAQQQSNRIYLQIDGGVSYFSEGEANNGGDIEYDVGYTVGGRLGVKLTETLRAEADLSYSSNDVDEIEGANLNGIDLEFSALTFGVGVFTDILTIGAINPYIGAGIGGVYKKADGDGVDADKETDLTANGEIGISVDLTRNIAIVPHYRLLWLDDVGDGEQLAHWFRIGLRFTP